jgi:ABC-type polysaccharide/polyol phosphate export permease
MFLVEPVHWRLLPISMVQWRAVQGIVNAGLMGVIGFWLGARIKTDQLWIAVLIIVLSLVAGLAIGTLSASLKVLAKQGDPILFVYGLLVQIFSGVFFPVETLPVSLRWISWLIPHTYAIAALRQAVLPAGSADTGSLSLGVSLAALAGFSVVLFPLALWVYGRALEYGRKLGVLAGY